MAAAVAVPAAGGLVLPVTAAEARYALYGEEVEVTRPQTLLTLLHLDLHNLENVNVIY